MNTVLNNVVFEGKGIHSGLPVRMVIKPSDVRGIFFKRVDMPDSDLISAMYDNVGETKMRNTTVGNVNGAHVQTIEHLMAALFLCGIDSAVIEIDGKETPILDGSAELFYKKIKEAVANKNKIKKIVVRRPVVAYAKEVTKQLPLFVRLKIWLFNKISGRKADGFVKLMPNSGKELKVVATLIYPEKIIGRQTFEYVFDGTKKSLDNFIKNIAAARTFGKYSEWEYLKAHGMGRGADETNVIALNDSGNGTLNDLKWGDEFVRHKIIDAIGDMYTSGGMICGDLESYKGSHALNNIVLRKLFSNPDNYDIIDG